MVNLKLCRPRRDYCPLIMVSVISLKSRVMRLFRLIVFYIFDFDDDIHAAFSYQVMVGFRVVLSCCL